MSHRALVYNVRVHERYKPGEVKPFGNLDDNGTYLGEFLQQACATGFGAVSHDGNRDVSCSRSVLSEPDVQLVLRPGERGVRADIVDATGQTAIDLFEQRADHTQVLKCGCLFRLPRNQTDGRLAIHVNHGRSVKSLIETGISKRFKEAFPDLVLKINPCVDSAAFAAALDRDELLSVNLYRHAPSGDISDGGKWGRADTGLKLQLSIKADVKNKRLLPTLVKKALEGDNGAYGQIIEFAGLEYEEAKFEVELEDGTKRSYNIHDLDAGHAMSQNIAPAIGNDGYPTDDSIFAELGRVLTEME